MGEECLYLWFILPLYLLSSNRQSSKELSDCRVPLVSFLREYHHHIYNPTPQGLLSTCHTLCMLTRYTKIDAWIER